MQLVITKKENQTTSDGAVYYKVTMSDGSEWVCDYKGENWRSAALEERILNSDFLMKKFLAGKTQLKK